MSIGVASWKEGDLMNLPVRFVSVSQGAGRRTSECACTRRPEPSQHHWFRGADELPSEGALPPTAMQLLLSPREVCRPRSHCAGQLWPTKQSRRLDRAKPVHLTSTRAS
jgi:hypothetical protein